MNYTRDVGWYYISANNRSAAWSGVPYLHRFLTSNTKAGPYASELPLTRAVKGDIIQLSFDGQTYSHSLFIVDVGANHIYIATHTYDSYDRPLDTYQYQKSRFLHIEGVRS